MCVGELANRSIAKSRFAAGKILQATNSTALFEALPVTVN